MLVRNTGTPQRRPQMAQFGDGRLDLDLRTYRFSV